MEVSQRRKPTTTLLGERGEIRQSQAPDGKEAHPRGEATDLRAEGGETGDRCIQQLRSRAELESNSEVERAQGTCNGYSTVL